MREQIPNTTGMFRSLEIKAPPGTVFNAQMPAASSMRGITTFRTVDVILDALAGILPDRVLVGSNGGNSLVIIGGHRVQTGKRYVDHELMSGTWRADQIGTETMASTTRPTLPIIFRSSNPH